MAFTGVNRANVAVTDTFDTWRIRTNEVNTTLNLAAAANTADTLVYRDNAGSANLNVLNANTTIVTHTGSTDSAISVVSAVAAHTDGTYASIKTTGGLYATLSSKFAADLTIGTNLTVNGNITALETQQMIVEDTLIHFGNNNPSNILDLGWYGQYVDNGVTKFSGLFIDATDSKFNLFRIINKAIIEYPRAARGWNPSGIGIVSMPSLSASSFNFPPVVTQIIFFEQPLATSYIDKASSVFPEYELIINSVELD